MSKAQYSEAGAVKGIGVRVLSPLVLLAIVATVFATGTAAEEAPGNGMSSVLATKSELLADYALPIISLDEVINPASSMEGDYPVHEFGSYTGLFFWMDNHRLIKSTLDKEKHTAAIESWDVDSGATVRYGWGKISCYADGMISKIVYQAGASPTTSRVIQKGLLGQEKDFVFDKSIPIYYNSFECGDKPSIFTTQYVKEHPDDVVVALRSEHGFLVIAKRTLFPDGRTDKVLQQEEIVLHAPGKEPVHIKTNPWFDQDQAPWQPSAFAAYYPFVRAYTFQNRAQGTKDITLNGMLSRLANSAFILAVDGNEIRKVKVPDVFLKGYGAAGPYLSRRGLLWLGGSVLPNKGNGIYLSRGEQVKRVTTENSHDGVVSPDGCRLAYTTTGVDLFGQITEPTLKVIELCKGGQYWPN